MLTTLCCEVQRVHPLASLAVHWNTCSTESTVEAIQHLPRSGPPEPVAWCSSLWQHNNHRLEHRETPSCTDVMHTSQSYYHAQVLHPALPPTCVDQVPHHVHMAFLSCKMQRVDIIRSCGLGVALVRQQKLHYFLQSGGMS